MKRLVVAATLLCAAGLADAQTGAGAGAGVGVAASAACVPNPLGKRALYLRGTFNGWAAADAQRFFYHCDRFELITTLGGAHSFKIGDEEWSHDADFGVTEADANTTPPPPWRLTLKSKDIRFSFRGTHRLILNMSTPLTPTLQIETCPLPPLGMNTLFLRGTMNNWATIDSFLFQFRCDAYYLNVNVTGRHEFKLADSGWQPATTFGGEEGKAATVQTETSLALGNGAAAGAGNVQFNFSGEHTLRVAFDGQRSTLRIGPKSFTDANDSNVTDPLVLSVQHDSRERGDKSPFGAVPAGTAIDFGLSALPGLEGVVLVVEKRLLQGNQERLDYQEVARIPMTRHGKNTDAREQWRARHQFKDVSVYGYYFEISVAGKTFIYQNNRDAVYWTREKGSNGIGRIEDLPASRKNVRRFRHTVYAADFVVPAWARDAIYYYIFPDRFRNGDARNDPKVGVDTYQNQPVEFHRNWLDQPYKPGSGDGSDNRYNNDFFGGDLAGIIDKLDYIAGLGANTIYLTPVFHAASNHKYDTADYKNIDPRFGSNADFVRLTTEAAKRGIRVIPDTSLNHTGNDSIYFDRFAQYKSKGAFEGGKIQPGSPYASWYRFDATQREPEKQYKGWVDVVDLPELDKSSADFRQFAYGAKDSVMKLWLDRGAAGWRMDVAPWVPDDFWREWRRAIKQHKPDALTIAETWFDASKFFLGDAFDSTMNYILRNAILDYAKGGKARDLYPNLELMREVYPPQAFYALMNLLSSHDVARTLHVFGFESEATDAEKIRLAKQRLRLAVFFQLIYPGAPTVYYGDEVGVTGGDDPYNRATYPWADLGGKPDLALLADFKRLIKMRKDHAVLRHGTIDAPIYIDDNVIVLVRRLGDSIAITATNNAASARTVSFKLPVAAGSTDWKDALTGALVGAKEGAIEIAVPALFGTVLLNH